MVGRGVSGIEADRELEFALGALPVPVLRGLHVSERGVRLGRIGIEHDRRRRACGGLRPDLGRREHAIVRQEAVAVGQAAVRQRIVAVLDDGALEELHGLAKPLLGALVHVIAPLQIQVPSRQIVGRPPAAQGARAGDIRLELLDHRLRDGFLGREIRRLEVVRVGPQVRAARPYRSGASSPASLPAEVRTLPLTTSAACSALAAWRGSLTSFASEDPRPGRGGMRTTPGR